MAYVELWGGPLDGLIVPGSYPEYFIAIPPEGRWFADEPVDYAPLRRHVYGDPKRNADRNPGHVRMRYKGVR